MLKLLILIILLDQKYHVKSQILQQPRETLEKVATDIQSHNYKVREYRSLHTRQQNLIGRHSPHTVTTAKLAASHRRKMETHFTCTSDGYILTLHRLSPTSKPKKQPNAQHKSTILLHHGLLGSSVDWILLGPLKSLPYILFDAGHDVWLANSRGNLYSRDHESLSIYNEEYWNFSWQDIGEYDLPAIFRYIRKIKNSTEPIDYIGHSMGATVLLVLLSLKHKYNSYIRIAFLLAPLAIMTNTRGPLKMLAGIDEEELADLFGTKEFMPKTKNLSSLPIQICKSREIYCRNPLFFLTGEPLYKGTTTKSFGIMIKKYIPAGGSSKTIMHYLQVIQNKKFHKYGLPHLQFNVSNICTPVYIFSSSDDLISNVRDNHKLYLSVLNPIGHIVINNLSLSHTEFVWGYNADVLLYYKIRDMISYNATTVRKAKFTKLKYDLNHYF